MIEDLRAGLSASDHGYVQAREIEASLQIFATVPNRCSKMRLRPGGNDPAQAGAQNNIGGVNLFFPYGYPESCLVIIHAVDGAAEFEIAQRTGDPLQILIEFHPRNPGEVRINKLIQALLLEEKREERIPAPRISQCDKILEEAYLERGLRK